MNIHFVQIQINPDEFVTTQKFCFPVIPAKGGIQLLIRPQLFRTQWCDSPLTLPSPPKNGGEGRGEGGFSEEVVCSNMDPE
jgi:hypothetical protein